MRRFYMLMVLLLLAACHKAQPKPQLPTVDVSIYIAKEGDVPASFDFVGNTESSHLVDIRARVEGYLDAIAYEEGGMVQLGDLLFQIDPRPFQAKLDSARAELAQQKAILWNATITRKRYEPLYAQGAASQKDLDDAIAQELAAQASVDAAAANVRTAELNLNYTTIRAPIAGMSSAANYREGSLITQSLPKPLTTVAVLDPIWVNFSLSESQILANKQDITQDVLLFPQDMNFKVEIILADNSVYPYTGVVNFAEPYYSQSTGTMNVRSTFPNPKAFLKPGQFVRVRVFGATWHNVYLVPQRAVFQGSGGLFVYIVGADGKAETVSVDTGVWVGDYWIIKQGLKEGDKVVVDGINKIQKGQPVKIVKTLPPPPDETFSKT